MRGLLIALALTLAPGVASAQRAAPSSIQEIGIWGQKIAAAQRPVTDSYQKCSPVMKQLVDAMRSPPSARKDDARVIMPAIRACVADIKAAAAVSRDALAAVGPMPKSVEQGLRIDSADMLRRSAAAIDGMVKNLSQSEEMLDALAAGDNAGAMRKWAEARASAGSAIDGQIALFETLRRSMPLETHKAMFDVRLAMTRATRAMVVFGPGDDGAALATALHAEAGRARAAANALRADWAREGASLRAAVSRLNDPTRKRLVAALDTAFGEIAATGDQVADMLAKLSADNLLPADVLQTLDRLATAEAHLLDVIRGLSATAAQLG
jgi:hypothetical protein